MALPSTAVAAALETVRRTNTAHLDAVDALERAVGAEMAQLASDRRALEDDRAAFARETEEKLARDEEDEARMKAAAPPPGEKIRLNVGGARFEASRAVLTRVEDSMLGRMFGRCDAMLQADPDDGSIFIDRDGERFRLILDFLRDLDGSHTQRAIRALAETAQESMMKELDYFGLEVAVFGARRWTDDAAFRPGPALGSARVCCAAVLAAGRVVVFGGFEDESALNTTEVLDTQTMTFTAGPNLLTGRYGCAAVQIDADRVLLVGGRGNSVLDTTEIFHLSTLTVTPGPALQSARYGCAAVALDARRVLVVGGNDGRSYLSNTEIFSLDTMAFAPGPTLAWPRSGCAVVALDEHRILVAGGHWGLGSLQTTEILDIRTMAFSPGPSMGSARSFFAAVPVDAQHILVIGGRDAVATTELLDVATMEFSPGPAMRIARYGIAAARLDATSKEPGFVVIGGETLTTRDEDDSEEEEDDDADTICLSSTEVLSVEEHRGAPAARSRR